MECAKPGRGNPRGSGCRRCFSGFESERMRLKFFRLLLSIVLITVLSASAQQGVPGFVLFDDGERIEIQADQDMEEGVFKLLDSSKDGRCEFLDDGEAVLTIVKVGQIYTATFDGQTVTRTADEIRRNFATAKALGHLNACRSNLKNLATGLEMYFTDHQGSYPDDLSKLVPDYLTTIPDCPASKTPSYSYKVLPEPDSYQMQCTGGAHGGAGLETGLPAYNGQQGIVEKLDALK